MAPTNRRLRFVDEPWIPLLLLLFYDQVPWVFIFLLAGRDLIMKKKNEEKKKRSMGRLNGRRLYLHLPRCPAHQNVVRKRPAGQSWTRWREQAGIMSRHPVRACESRNIHDGLDKGPFHRDCFYVTGILSQALAWKGKENKSRNLISSSLLKMSSCFLLFS